MSQPVDDVVAELCRLCSEQGRVPSSSLACAVAKIVLVARSMSAADEVEAS